jgi:hypothetical protein
MQAKQPPIHRLPEAKRDDPALAFDAFEHRIPNSYEEAEGFVRDPDTVSSGEIAEPPGEDEAEYVPPPDVRTVPKVCTSDYDVYARYYESFNRFLHHLAAGLVPISFAAVFEREHGVQIIIRRSHRTHLEVIAAVVDYAAPGCPGGLHDERKALGLVDDEEADEIYENAYGKKARFVVTLHESCHSRGERDLDPVALDFIDFADTQGWDRQFAQIERAVPDVVRAVQQWWATQ